MWFSLTVGSFDLGVCDRRFKSGNLRGAALKAKDWTSSLNKT